MTLVGRDQAGGPVDDITLLHGHWPTKQGEIAVDTNYFDPAIGATLKFPDAPGAPTLTVVGIVRSVSQTADAWVTSEQATMFHTGTPKYEMLYRFSQAHTTTEVDADRAALRAASPSGSLLGTESYLSIKQVQTTNTAAFVPFIVAFGVIGLVMSVLIISTIVSGSVGSATWRIGVLKSLGLTPTQVTRAYVAQALIPATIGAAVGALAGNMLAIPVLNGAENTYGTTKLSIPLWVNALVPALALLLVALAAIAPAARAGKMRAAEAIAVGRAPSVGRARAIQRWAARLPLPRSLSLGLATPFARPARSSALAAAVVFGAASVAFATGLALSLNGVQHGRDLNSAGSVTVNTDLPPGGDGKARLIVRGGAATSAVAADPSAVAAAIQAQPGTKRFYATVVADLHVDGISGLSHVIGYTGDSSWATHQMISGHWLDGPAEAVASPRFLTAAGLRVGDTVRVTNGGKSASVRVVGSEFELSDDGMDLLTDVATLSAIGIDRSGMSFQVELQHGVSARQYLDSLSQRLRPLNAEAFPVSQDKSSVIVAMDALVALLTVMMVVVAALGVLNTVVLETRERVHDLGVLKALGMSPRQTVTTVITSAGVVGLVGGLIGVPLGIAVHAYVMPIMGHVAGTTLPKADLDVYGVASSALLVLGGVAIAIAGAMLPAGWAARIRTATALRTE
jgi:putative ABC transport system permease protein